MREYLMSLSTRNVSSSSTEDSYVLILKSIHAFSAQALSHPADLRGCVIDNGINISLFLLLASCYVNPRSLSIEGQQQLALGDSYYQHSLTKGAFLRDVEIPSHVSATQTDERVAHVNIKRGTRLIQYVRPNGFLGDYYAAADKIKPEQLGISSLVSDSLNPGQEVARVKLEIIVINTEGFPARVSTAKSANDFWSIKNKTVPCPGGGEQYYMPLPVSVRQSGLLLLQSDNLSIQKEIEAIAKLNNLIIVGKEEALRIVDMTSFADAYTRDEVLQDVDMFSLDFHTLQRLAYDALFHGNYQTAATYLNFALNCRGVTLQDKTLLRCVLGMIYVSLGQSGRGAKLLQDFTNYYISLNKTKSDKFHKMDELASHAKLHLARSEDDPELAIAAFESLLTTTSHEGMQHSLLNLEIGMRYNIIANQYSDETTFDDFNEEGQLDGKKQQFAIDAEKFLQASLQSDRLPFQESLICMIELAFSLHKQRKNNEALTLLTQVQEKLEILIADVKKDFSTAALLDLHMQLLGVRLGIGLNQARSRAESAVKYLLEVCEDLQNSPPMMVKLIFKRWVGRNANNLFIEGWFHQKIRGEEDMSKQGASLIGLYRKFIPLDIDNICRELKANRTEELDLAYLGMAEPAGVSDKDFKKITEALASNTSLKKLFIRKFSKKESNHDKSSEPFVYRAKVLFDALSAAQKNGQQLVYLSYSGSRFNYAEEMQSAINYLENNKHLKVLQASLYDWKDQKIFTDFANTIATHPTLTTLLTGILKLEGAGEIIYQSCIKSSSLRYVHKFPGKMVEKSEDDPVRVNNEWIARLSDELSWESKMGVRLA
jgi:hypothetical protein